MYFDISVYSTFIFFALINNGSTSRCKTISFPEPAILGKETKALG